MTGRAKGVRPDRRHLALIGYAAVFAVPLLLLALNARSYLPFLSDDALISLRYAWNLDHGLGLVWNAGERVEGYSNLLWTLLCAGAGACGLDLIDAARLLGYAGMGAAVAGVAFSAIPDKGSRVGASLAGGLVAVAAPLGIWAVGGLEQPLLAATLVWALVLARPLLDPSAPPLWRPWAVGALFAAVSLTRLDGALLAGCAACAVLAVRVRRGLPSRPLAPFAVVPLAALSLQVAFRRLYYGEWVPNTALVKLTPSGHHLALGLTYVARGLLVSWPLAAAALAAAVLLARRGAADEVLLVVAPLAAWLAYVVVIGGDVFAGHRHLVVAVCLLGLLCAAGLRSVAQDPPPTLAPWAAPLAALLLLAAFWVVGQRDAESAVIRAERWEWDGRAVGTMLKRAFGDRRPLLAVSAAGCVPYWSELPCIDTLGLNDHYLPRHRPRGVGDGFIGHELGDGGYVLDRSPDIVCFGSPYGGPDPLFIGERQMLRDPRFLVDYTLVTFETSTRRGVRTRLWVRRDSPVVGIVQDSSGFWVPSYLLNGELGTVAHPDASGAIVVTVRRDMPARLRDIMLPPGRYAFTADDGAEVRATVDRECGSFEKGQLVLSREAPIVVDVVPAAGRAEVDVSGLTLRRVG